MSLHRDKSDTDPLNIKVPNPARIYDFTLGGANNYEADRRMAARLIELMPSLQKWMRLLRAALQEAARRFWEEGFRDFVDFASGLPNQDHIHQVLPDAKVIYSDIDPVTIAQAREIVADNPNIIFLEADVRDAGTFLRSEQVTQFLAGKREVAFICNGIFSYLTAAEIKTVFRALYDWSSPKSKLYITFETKDPDRTTPQLQAFFDLFAQMGVPLTYYALPDCIRLCRPWRVQEGSLMPVSDFLGLPDDFITKADREGVALELYAAVLEKPPV